MRDIPMFTTEYGVASLYLGNVAYTNSAYIRILDTKEPKTFLEECRDFCRSAGAEHIYATGHDYLSKFTLYASVLEMCREPITEETNANLVAVTEKSLEQWRRLYNDKMKAVPNAAYITFHVANKYLQRGNCYFVYQDNELIGIGVAGCNRIDAIASLQKGAGRDVVIALGKGLSGNEISLQVADTNTKALELYRALGFVEKSVIECWYKIK